MRVAFDMTPAMEMEVRRIMEITDIRSVPEIFRKAFTLLRIHVEAAQKGRSIIREDVEKDGCANHSHIILPFEIKKG